MINKFSKLNSNLGFQKSDWIVFGALSVLVLFSFYLLFYPTNQGDSNFYEVPIVAGSTLSDIANLLKSEGYIRDRYLFALYVVANGQQNYLRAGEYLLSPSMSMVQIADKIISGQAESTDVVVFIPEGENVWEIDQILADKKLIRAGEFAEKTYPDEGYFFPDTYRINKKATVDEIIEILRSTFEEKTASFSLDEETIIIASMLEKEVRSEEDMRLVAGIIQNRIKIGMALQIDATVAYGSCLRDSLENKFIGNCDVSDAAIARELRIDSPYNSYTRKGLPRGPISNPGIKSIQAALNPKESNYFFYLSARDGTTIYSRTGNEHVANRRKYLGL